MQSIISGPRDPILQSKKSGAFSIAQRPPGPSACCDALSLTHLLIALSGSAVWLWLSSANGTARLPFIIITVLSFKEGKFVTNRGAFSILFYIPCCCVLYIFVRVMSMRCRYVRLPAKCWDNNDMYSVQRKIYYATEKGGWVHGRICAWAMNGNRAPYARTYAPF